MRTTLATIALAGTLGLTGGALLAPAAASASTAESAASSTLSTLRDALTGLVTDGTLTSAQADRVATTLDARLPDHRGHGRHGRHGGVRLSQETVAGVLGVTVEELRAAHDAGRTLAQLAEEEGVTRDVLVDRLVAAAREQLAAEVEAGRLTQEQADARAEGLEERVEAKVDRVHGDRGRRSTPTAAPSPTA